MKRTSFLRFSSPSPRRCFTSRSSLEEENYVTILRRCAETADLCGGQFLHGKFLKGFLPFSLFVRNHLLNVYVKCGDLVGGRKLFDEMSERNVVTWSAIINGSVRNGRVREALLLFSDMLRDGTCKPNEFTLVSVLQACSLSVDLVQAYVVFGLIVRLGFVSNIFLINAFLTALIRHGKLEEALEIFEQCPAKDIVTWNAVMAGFLQHSDADVPLFWYRMTCEQSDIKPDNFTFASVLTGLAALSDLQMGQQVHAQLVKFGHGVEIRVGNALIDMYIKNERLIDGFKAFEEMLERDVCSWTQIADGCLQSGEPTKALEIILEMKHAGVRLNRFTLVSALNACASLASIEEGKKFHGLRIKLGHNAVDVLVDNALLDMYTKSGCMEDAWGVFRTMEDHTVVSWTTMIMGCAQNGQAREGLETFEEMMRRGTQPNYITFICVLYACCEGGFIEEGWKYFTSMTEHGVTRGDDHYVCMVTLLGRVGKIKEAEELILAMPFRPSGMVWQALLGACLVHGDVETGRRAADKAMSLEAKDPSSYVLLSNMFASLSSWDNVGFLRELMEKMDVMKVQGTSWIHNSGIY